MILKSVTDNFGLAKLASWKDMTLTLVGYFTNLGKTTRLAVLSHTCMDNIVTRSTGTILENVEHCGGEPEQAANMHMNRLSSTLK